MLNRRHLRIKVLHALYSFFQSDERNNAKLEKQLFDSIDKIYDLYLYLLLTFQELQEAGLHRIAENKKKLRPTDEDLNPNRKWVDNEVVLALKNSVELQEIAEDRKVHWNNDERKEMFRKIFVKAREGEIFFTHLNNEQTGLDADKDFAIAVFKEEIANSSLLQHFFEEESIVWIDDLDLVCSMVIKTIKQYNGGEIELLSLYKDEKDERHFVRELFQSTIALSEENEQIIDGLTKNWEIERIAKMDIILMKMALAEMQTFPTIPTNVTMNEYIEISKFYSTPKSNGFINGVLDKAIVQLTQSGKLEKAKKD